MKTLTVLFYDAASALGCSSLFFVQFVLYSFTASLLCVWVCVCVCVCACVCVCVWVCTCVCVFLLLHTAGATVKSVVLDGSHMPEIDYTVVYVSGEH